VVGVGLGARDLVAGELAGHDRVHALDALGRFAVGDGADLERVQLAELRDLVEGQGGVVDEPDGGRLRHQKRFRHFKHILLLARVPGAGGGQGHRIFGNSRPLYRHSRRFATQRQRRAA
jgi:hypothetical protein